MEIGIFWFPTAAGPDPAELGRYAEGLGFESVWVPEHSHIPVERVSPWPGGPELPREYFETFDPLVALTAIAAATTELRLGTGVALLIERDPILLAKALASLDVISGGRLEVGVGAGWNIEEMRNHGTDPTTRFRRMRESVEAMKAIWTEDEAEYHGRIIDFDPIWCWPKPVQKPHPPILVGGRGERVLDRVVAYGDGWIPNRVRSPEELGERITELQRRAEAAGRGPIPVTVFGAKPEIRLLERLKAVGVARSLLFIDPGSPDDVERHLDKLAEVAAQWDG